MRLFVYNLLSQSVLRVTYLESPSPGPDHLKGNHCKHIVRFPQNFASPSTHLASTALCILER